LKKKYISIINTFEKNFWNFPEIVGKISNPSNKHYKKFHYSWTSLDSRNRKENAKNTKKIKKK